MQLLGIASDGAESELQRTAVIATPHQVYLVKEGEQIAFRFLVTRIGADAVELRDLAHDSTFSLALR
jgi:Tfp pilus assembly protein PilP